MVATSGIDAQRAMMQSFSARGLENPAKSVTKRGFREKWVMGIIEDDSPYSLGEKSGMKKVLDYILPKGLTVPSHQTVRRDLDVLYDKLDSKVNTELQVCIPVALLQYTRKLIAIKSNSSKIAIASDLWTSKNSVYAFAGTVAFWIDNNWELRETALELLPLSGDHSGKASGKLIFKALKRRGIERKLSTFVQVTCHHCEQITYKEFSVANGADNASSNGPLNETLSKYLRKVSGVHIDPRNMQVGCGGHVLNISCQ